MSIRVILCSLYVLAFSIYAYRNWFASLCAALLLMSVMEHPDMPKSIAGIQGLNLMNLLVLNVLIAWWSWRRNLHLGFDLPRRDQMLFLFYFIVVIFSFLRLFLHRQQLREMSAAYLDRQHMLEVTSATYLVSEYLINCIKWMLPCLLLFDGCRTRRRMLIALAAILGLYVLLAIQVIHRMPLSSAMFEGDLNLRAAKIIQREIGYSRVNMSMMLAGASWAILTTQCLFQGRRHRLAVMGLFVIVALGQALTAGRAGYFTWGTLGLIIGVVRWRRFLLLIPAAVVAIAVFLPAVRERMLMGFGGQQRSIIVQDDLYEMTAGRNLMWPYVIKKISSAPLFGYGREAMRRTGLSQQLFDDTGEGFAHPHDGYLEMLLDNGVIGFALAMPLFFMIVWRSLLLLLDRADAIYCAVGGVTFALTMALMLAALGSQTFYAREGSVGMWAAVGLMLRLFVERSRSQATGVALFDEHAESFIDGPEEFAQLA
jgi:O-antigen ligase